jgi:pilus assembly protein CpaB
MNQRFISVLVFAFAVATGASFLLYRMLNSKVNTNPAAMTTQVIVASRNLDLGTVIHDADLKAAHWAGSLPTGALQKKEDLVGRGVIAAIFNGEPILETRLARRGAGGGLAAMIPPGMRAVAVRVNEVVGVGGFVVPGMRVDVLISGNPPNNGRSLGSLTTTLLQNIEVLSAGQDFKKDAEGKPVSVQAVNLLVTPEQAEKLSLAANQTTIQLVLRNPLDTQVAKTSGTALALLFGRLAAPAEEPSLVARRPRPVVRASAALPPQPVMSAPRGPAPVLVETLNGPKRGEMKFQENAQ